MPCLFPSESSPSALLGTTSAAGKQPVWCCLKLPTSKNLPSFVTTAAPHLQNLKVPSRHLRSSSNCTRPTAGRCQVANFTAATVLCRNVTNTGVILRKIQFFKCKLWQHVRPPDCYLFHRFTALTANAVLVNLSSFSRGNESNSWLWRLNKARRNVRRRKVDHVRWCQAAQPSENGPLK